MLCAVRHARTAVKQRHNIVRNFSHKVISGEISPDLLVNASMGWGETFADNTAMVDFLRETGAVKSERVLAALNAIDRKWFTPQFAAEEEERRNPQKSAASLPTEYYDVSKPLKIGYGATMSSPQSHAQALELLSDHLKPGARVLDVGSGSGYLTAVMAFLVQERGGSTVGLDHMKELVIFSSGIIDQLNTSPPESVQDRTPLRCEFRCVNAMSEFGAVDDLQKFDCIHFGAAIPELPREFVDCLNPGGRMVVPIGPENEEQVLTVVDKTPDGKFAQIQEVTKTTFSPLHETREAQWQDRAARLAQVTAELQVWRDDYAKENNGQGPSAADLAQQPLFKEFQELRRLLKK